MSTDGCGGSRCRRSRVDGRGDNFTSDSRHFIFYESSLIRLSTAGRRGEADRRRLARRRARRRLPLRRRRLVRPRPRRALHNVLCRFGRTRVPATVQRLAPARVLRAPGLANGRVRLEVSFNAQEFTGGPADAAGFTYITLSNRSADEAAVAARPAAEEANTSLGNCAQRRTRRACAHGLNCDAYHRARPLRGRVMTVWHDWPRRAAPRGPSSTATSATCRAVFTTRAGSSRHGRSYAETAPRPRCAPPPLRRCNRLLD